MNRSKRVLIIILAIILIIPAIPRTIADGESWLTGWNYRKSHTINGTTAGAQTDYQIKITVHYGAGSDSDDDVYLNSKCRTDFGDIRFTKADGDTELDYWIEEKTDSNNAIIWVEVDSIPDDPNSVNIYIYYGKADETTTSNILNTWIWGDEFSATGNWVKQQGTGAWSIHDGILDIDANTGAGADFAVYNPDYPDNTVAGRCLGRGRYTAMGGTGGTYKIGSGDGSRPPNMAVVPNTFAPGTLHAFLEDAGFWGTLGNKVFTQDIWYLVEWKYITDDFAGWVDGVEIGATNPTTEPVVASNDYAMIECYRMQIEIDWLVYGKYVEPEPVHDVWGSEESIIPSIPDLLFGAGFNATSPYVELHWNHSLVDVQFFEVQNSSDSVSWTYLGQSNTANYTDSQVVNGTERYYRVRACNQTDAVWFNSSWTAVNFETVYFISGGAPPGNGDVPPVDDYSVIFLAIGVIMCLAIAFLYAKNR